MALEAPDDGTVATVTRLPGVADPEPGTVGEETPNLPAVPAEAVAEVVPAGHEPARAVYADITRVPGERLPILPRAAARPGEHPRRARAWPARRPGTAPATTGCAPRCTWWPCWSGRSSAASALVTRQVHWWWVLEQHPLRSKAVADGDSREWMRLHREAKAGPARLRGLVLARRVAGAGLAGVLVAELRAAVGMAWRWLRRAAGPGPRRPPGRPPHRRDRDRAAGLLRRPPTRSSPRRSARWASPQINAALKPDKDGRVSRDPVHLRRDARRARAGPATWTCRTASAPSDILAKREALASGPAPPAVGDLARRGARGAPGAAGPVGRDARHQQDEAAAVPAGQGQADGPVRRDPVRHRPARCARSRCRCSRSTG